MSPKCVRLRNSTEFRTVYENGRRLDGRLVTVFIQANELGRHRLGITASRKMARHAVARNRAKRLIREAFRLSAAELDALGTKFDWVFNPRRGILNVKVAAVVAELRVLVDRLRFGEQESAKKAEL